MWSTGRRRRGAGEIRCPSGHRYGMRDGYLDCSEAAVAGGSTDRTFASFGFEWNNFDEVRTRTNPSPRSTSGTSTWPASRGRSGWMPVAGKVATPGSWPHIWRSRRTRRLVGGGGGGPQSGRHAVRAGGQVRPEGRALRGREFRLHCQPRGPPPSRRSAPGIERLLTYLAPGGRILLYLYSRPPTPGLRATALRLAAALRTVTVRLPHRLLKVLSEPIAAGLYAGIVLPGAYGDRRGVAALSGLPIKRGIGESPSAASSSTPSIA